MLDTMQKELLSKSRKMTEESIVEVKTMDELKKAIDSKKVARGMFCNAPECEDCIKEKSGGASTRGILMDKKAAGRCIHCGKPAKAVVHFAKSY
jgi:prolyl-tRNA synthetase